MKNFLVIYHTPAQAAAQMANVTPEQQAKGLEAWMAWKAKHEKHVVDFGAPLGGGQSLTAEGSWNGSNKEVNGYSLIQGESLEEVKAIFSDHPHLSYAPGTSIEVHEAVAM